MRPIRELLGITPSLKGLEHILQQVADGQLSQSDAARQIRVLALKSRIPSWLPRLFGILGIIQAFIGLGFAAFSVMFFIGARGAAGTVIVGGQSPIAEYYVDGKRFTVESFISTAPPAHQIGDDVPILYRPDNPSKARFNTFTDLWFFPVGFTISGITLFVFCSLFLPRWLGSSQGRGIGQLNLPRTDSANSQ